MGSASYTRHAREKEGLRSFGTRPASGFAALLLQPFELWWAVRLRPEWREAPLVSVREGRVTHATPGARRLGVTRGMPLAAARLRGELLVTEATEVELQAGWESVVREMYGLTPFLEEAGQGLLFLRVSLAEARLLAQEYQARVGFAHNLELAHLAALSTLPGRCRTLPPGSDTPFLSLLPLRFLAGVGLSGYSLQRLRWLGVESVGELAAWRRPQLEAFLGEEAGLLLPYLHGPRRERLPLAAPPRALRRTIQFEEPLFEPGPLHAATLRLAGELGDALGDRSSNRLTVTAQVGGAHIRASRYAKRPLARSREIALLAWLVLEESGAAPLGIDELTVELAQPVRRAAQGRLWRGREQREKAWEALLARFPAAAVEVEWLDPYAESADLAWRWRHPALEEEQDGEGAAHEAAVPGGEVTGAQVEQSRAGPASGRQAGTRELVLG